MLNDKYDWILDFTNINDEDFHDEFLKMTRDLSSEVMKKIKDRREMHCDCKRYELFLKDDNEELLLIIDKKSNKYVLKVKNLNEKKFNDLVADAETMDLLCLQSYTDDREKRSEFFTRICVDDEENIYIDFIQRGDNQIVKRRLCPINYYDILQNIESVKTKKR